jgi:hypothetical protein
MRPRPEINQDDIKAAPTLKGEEAMEFKRFMYANNLGPAGAARILIARGLIQSGYLPDWWERRQR